ncbi:MAG: 16S rRNA (guanine(966)-N(2))-methyltransferase RsmD [Deltaproteobacteria bacterium]|nr:MAG: 16S rRNA (guanine(966)-N(2))-methyltransferase RsmD [Deltaproteobacteria bacterium]
MGRLRITGGTLRGRYIRTPPGSPLRPTAERVREALFSILGDWVEGAHALDLFAGTGALGIEALSRGAKKCVFVEKGLKEWLTLRENLRSLGIEEERWEARRAEAIAYLKEAAKKRISFDVAFLDPPYGQPVGEECLVLLERANLIKIGGIVVFESRRGWNPPALERLTLEGRRRYGDTELFIFSFDGGSR